MISYIQWGRPVNDESTVVLYRVTLDARHFSQSRTTHIVEGDRAERAARIDLVRIKNDFYLLHYDKLGYELTDTCHDTESEAMRQAEYEFGVKKEDWLPMLLS